MPAAAPRSQSMPAVAPRSRGMPAVALNSQGMLAVVLRSLPAAAPRSRELLAAGLRSPATCYRICRKKTHQREVQRRISGRTALQAFVLHCLQRYSCPSSFRFRCHVSDTYILRADDAALLRNIAWLHGVARIYASNWMNLISAVAADGNPSRKEEHLHCSPYHKE